MAFSKVSIYQGGSVLSGGLQFDDQGKATVVVKYETDDATTTGLGFTVDFDGDRLDVDSVTSVLSQDNIVPGTRSGTGATSKLAFGWVSVYGNWPGSLTADLATITFSDRGTAGTNTGAFIAFTSTPVGHTAQTDNPAGQVTEDASSSTGEEQFTKESGFLDESAFSLKIAGIEIDPTTGTGIEGLLKIAEWTMKVDGNALVFYYSGIEKFRLSSVDGASSVSSRFVEFKYISTNNQTSYTGTDDFGIPMSYTPGKLVVFMNGVRLAANIDFTATNGSSVTMTEPTNTGDILLFQSL